MAEQILPWQSSLIEMAHIRERRIVDVIYDNKGTNGKSAIAEYFRYHDLGMALPPMKNVGDIMQFCYRHQNKPAYLIDMPRAMKKNRLAEFYAGIENLKDGFVYVKRNKPRATYMNAPRVFIFTNTLPEFDTLSVEGVAHCG